MIRAALFFSTSCQVPSQAARWQLVCVQPHYTIYIYKHPCYPLLSYLLRTLKASPENDVIIMRVTHKRLYCVPTYLLPWALTAQAVQQMFLVCLYSGCLPNWNFHLLHRKQGVGYDNGHTNFPTRRWQHFDPLPSTDCSTAQWTVGTTNSDPYNYVLNLK